MATISQRTSTPSTVDDLPRMVHPTPSRIIRPHNPVEAERLKVLGNELYQQGKYVEALDKYTEAVNLDKRNAIIFANRAAVHLAMKEYVDTVFDLERATSIDPTYTKAWWRLGSALYALSSWEESINAWQKALQCLSKPTLTQQELSLKAQVQQSLRMAKQASAKNDESQQLAPSRKAPDFAWMESPSAPWNRARALAYEKDKARTAERPASSCVFGILYAEITFKEGMDVLSELLYGQMSHESPDLEGLGVPCFFERITNAILCDERVFRLWNPKLMYGRIFRQYEFESRLFNGLVEGGGMQNTQKEILKRLEEEGWEQVLQNLQITVRYWVFQAFWRYYLYGPNYHSYKLYTRVLDFLDWSRSQWPDVPVSVCGAIFRKEFYIGVQRLRVQLMQMFLDTTHPSDTKHMFSVNDVAGAALQLAQGLEAHEAPDPSVASLGHFLVFWVTPRVHAFHAMAYASLREAQVLMVNGTQEPSMGEVRRQQCLQALGWDSPNDLSQPETESEREVQAHLAAAAYQYTLAAQYCAPDDPDYLLLLRKRVECFCWAWRPLSEILPICEEIRIATPGALSIWSSPHERGKWLKNNVAQINQFEEWCRKEVEGGRMRMDQAEKLIMPAGFLYEDISAIEKPFEPQLWRRDTVGGTGKRIPVELNRPKQKN